jgi:hypothetical protein
VVIFDLSCIYTRIRAALRQENSALSLVITVGRRSLDYPAHATRIDPVLIAYSAHRFPLRAKA